MSTLLDQQKEIKKFLKGFLDQRKYITSSSINETFSIIISSVLNYNSFLNIPEIRSVITENSNFSDLVLNSIYEKKAEIIRTLLKNLDSKEIYLKDKDHSYKKLLSYCIPEFEVYFKVRLYAGDIPISPEYTTELYFNQNINEKIDFHIGYNELTVDSYIVIKIYSMQLSQEKSFLGSVTIPIFDSNNLTANQGCHIYKIVNTFQNKNQENNHDKYKELDSLVFNYHNLRNNNNYEKEYPQMNINNQNSEEFANSWYYDKQSEILYYKDTMMKNYEYKLKHILSFLNEAFLSISLPSFECQVVYEEEKNKKFIKLTGRDMKSSTDKPNDLDLMLIPDIFQINLEDNSLRPRENPIEEKFKFLCEANENLDGNVRPEKDEQERINKAINQVDFVKMPDEDLALFRKYRYYFLNNNTKNVITKIANTVKWEDEKSQRDFLEHILKPWKNIETGDILYFLSRKFSTNTYYLNKEFNLKDDSIKQKIIRKGFIKLREYAVEHLDSKDNQLNFFILQLVQALRYEDDSNLETSPPKLLTFLIDKCKESIELCTHFFWAISVEKSIKNNSGIKIYDKCAELLKDKVSKKIKPNLDAQYEFINILLNISESLKNEERSSEIRKQKLKEEISKTENKFINKVLPLNPALIIQNISKTGNTVFKSNSFPVKYSFEITKDSKEYNTRQDQSKYDFIFKIGDDLRQDQLILQVMSFMDSLLKEASLTYPFTLYKVLATSNFDGFVEFVPNTRTVFDIEKKYPDSIYGYINELAQGDNEKLETFLNNFSNSLAGYCVVTYILGIGDRHLENLMVTQEGYLFHIDFGFIFGRDPKMFHPDIKITTQMKDTLNKINKDGYELFKQNCVNAYLVLRTNARLLINLFYLMIDSGISKLNDIKPLINLQNKFCLGMENLEAEKYIRKVIDDNTGSMAGIVADRMHGIAEILST